MEDVGLGDRHRYVAIGMRRTVIFEVERGPIELQGLLRREGFARNGRQRRRRKVEIPVLDSLGDQQMLVGILMGDDGCPFCIQPLIAICVIEVPMRVDQVLDRVAAEATIKLSARPSSARSAWTGSSRASATSAASPAKAISCCATAA